MTTLQQQIDALEHWQGCVDRLTDATYAGTTRELQQAVLDVDGAAAMIEDETGCTPQELENQLRVWRGEV